MSENLEGARLLREHFDTVAGMLREGASYGDVANRYKVTRSVVAGFVYRTGLKQPAEKARARAGQRTEVRAMIMQKKAAYKSYKAGTFRDINEKTAPRGTGVVMENLTTHLMCRAPLWVEEPDFKTSEYCGKPVVEGKSYCPSCYSRFYYTPVRD